MIFTKINHKKKIEIDMDIFYFKKYSRYVKQNAGVKASINLFLTLKKCRDSCYIEIHKRYERSFLRILEYYKMKYESHMYEDDPNRIFMILSHKPISEEVKRAFHDTDNDIANPHIMGAFLGYPAFVDVKKVSNMKSIGSIQFYFVKKNEEKKELIYGFRIPNEEITQKMLTKMNRLAKKYQKCVQTHLKTLYPSSSMIELSVNVK